MATDYAARVRQAARDKASSDARLRNEIRDARELGGLTLRAIAAATEGRISYEQVRRIAATPREDPSTP